MGLREGRGHAPGQRDREERDCYEKKNGPRRGGVKNRNNNRLRRQESSPELDQKPIRGKGEENSNKKKGGRLKRQVIERDSSLYGTICQRKRW